MRISLIVLICSVWLASCVSNAPKVSDADAVAIQNSTLKLEPGHHTGQARFLKLSPDKKLLYSSSYDKSIRVTDVASGREVKKVLGDIGKDLNAGLARSLVITPDNKYLIVAGGFSSDKRKRGTVRVYDPVSGEMLTTFLASKGNIINLILTPDGKSLITGSVRGQIDKWQVGSWDHEATLLSKKRKKGIWRGIYPDSFNLVKENGKHYLFASRKDRKIFKINIDDPSDSQQFHIKKDLGIKSNAKNLSVANDRLAFAVNQGYLSTLYVTDFDFNVITTFDLKRSVERVFYSPSGKYLLVGFHGSNNEEAAVGVYDVSRSYRRIGEYKDEVYDSGMRAMAFLNDENVFTLDDRGEIQLWNVKTLKGRTFVKGGIGIPTSVKLEGSILSVLYSDTNQSHRSFDLEEFGFVDKNRVDFHNLPHHANGTEVFLAPSKNGSPNRVLKIYKNDKLVASAKMYTAGHKRWTTAGVLPNGWVVAANEFGVFKVFNDEGIEVSELVGHISPGTAISVSGNTLVTAAKDQTVNFWNLDTVISGQKKVLPYVSVYLGKAGQWVVWTEDGFYDSSSPETGIGWQVDRGSDKASYFYAAAQFSRFLYRPDIVRKTLLAKDRSKVLNAIYQTEPELRKITANRLIERSPRGFYIKDVVLTDANHARLSIKFLNNGAPKPDHIAIFVNASQVLPKALQADARLKASNSLSYDIPLLSKHNTILVAVQNQWAEGVASTTVEAPNFQRPEVDAYVLAVGINDYRSAGVPSLSSPENDARAISQVLKNNQVYHHVWEKTLLSSETSVTSQLILDELKQIARKIRPQDKFVLFLAGHGLTNVKGYHFITQDTVIKGNASFSVDKTRGLKVNVANLPKTDKGQAPSDDLEFKLGTTLDWKRLNDALAGIKGQKVLVIDSCEAGGVMKKIKPSLRKLEKDIHNTQSIILSASSSQELARENKNNGLFTKAIIDSLKSYPSKKVFLMPLSKSIKQNVLSATNGVQNPTVVKPALLDDMLFYQKAAVSQ